MPTLLEPPTLEDVLYLRMEREQMEASLPLFAEGAWSILEPGRVFVPGWHVDALFEAMEALWRGDIKKLLINIPPRCMKSLTFGVLLPAWLWTKDPRIRLLFSTYDERLSIRDSVKTRRLIQSPWYQARWGDRVQIISDQNVKTKFETTELGYRLATSVGGSNTGEGGDWLVVDDGHNVKNIESDVTRQGTLDWWNYVMPTRVNNPTETRWIVGGQRVHEDDISGNILAKLGGTGEWVHLNLPMEYEPDHKCVIHVQGWQWEDPRTEPFTLLWPGRFPRAYVDGLKAQLGPYNAAAQLQQRPAPLEGGEFKRTWWQFWQYEGEDRPDVRIKKADGTWLAVAPITRPWGFERELNAWDMAFKDLDTSDPVAGHHYGKQGSRSFLLTRIHDQLSFTDSQDQVEELQAKMPLGGPVLIEDAANGPAILSSLRAKVPGLIPVSAAGGIEAKARAFAWVVRAGNCYLPHPELAPWVWDFIHEFSTFPMGKHNDDIAAWAHAMEELYGVKKPMVPITPEYQAKLFVSEAKLTPIPGIDAFRFWYFPSVKDGTPYPTCILGQVLPKGQIRILDAVQLEHESLDALIDRKVIPLLKADYRGVWKWRDVGNYAEGSNGTSEAAFRRVVEAKFPKAAVEAWEPDFEVRVNALKTILAQTNRLVINKAVSQGETTLLVHEALAGGYAYESDKAGHLTGLRPMKGEPLSAVGEALAGGLARIFVRNPAAPSTKKEQSQQREQQQRTAKGYSVRS